MLDKETKQNLAQYLDLMEAPVVFRLVQMTQPIPNNYSIL